MNVVKLGGNASREMLAGLAELQPLVLVHGGGAQMTRMLERLNVPTRFHEGQRVTDEATLEVAEMVLAGRVNKELAAQLQALGVKAVGVCGSDGGMLKTEVTRPELGLVGLELDVDPSLLQTLLNAGYLPVVAPLGLGADGQRYNVNADVSAAAIAKALKADRLILLTDVDGVKADGETLAELTPDQARALVAQGTAANGMMVKLEAAMTAADAGVRVQIGHLEKGTRIVTNHLLQNYRRQPLGFTHGSGATLYGTDGKAYLDFIGGLAVNSLGHAHPALTRALQDQAGKLLHVSNLFTIPEQEELARRLCTLAGMGRAFFCNSGTEANEAALKLARRHTGKARILSALQSFHGRTMGALAATGNPDYQVGFQPLPPGFEWLPYNDLKAWEAAFGDDVAAVLIECVQGEGGVIPAQAEFLQGLQRLCRQHGALLMIDEVQTGIGRTGTTFAFEQFDLQPDVVTLAKGLGAGVPIGALLMQEALAGVLVPGTHGCTFGGNPLSCRAALVVLDELPRLLPQVSKREAQLRQGLEAKGYAVRGMGLLLGAECPDAKAAEATCRENGLLVNAVRPTTLRLAPPLTISSADVEAALERIPSC